MSRLFLLSLLILGLSARPVAAADQPSTAGGPAARRAAAEKLLDLFNMDRTYDQAMEQTMQMAVQMVENQDLTPTEKANARKAVETSIAVSMQKFSWQEIKASFVDIYADVLDLEELDGLIAFYESPIGRRFLQKRPQLTIATMEKMQQLMQAMMPDLQAAVDKALELEAVIEIYTE